MTEQSETGCCPRFLSEPWDETEITWKDKKFVQDRVRSILHVPLNFPAVMKRNMALIEAADAKAEPMIVLSDENSPWGADVFIEVARDVPGAPMASLSGTFLSKVFEGPYKNVRSWMEEMEGYVRSNEHQTQKLYFYYTTCPKCAKAYGKNYVVLLAQV